MCRDPRYKLVARLYEDDELYDLESDPGETVNRIHDPELAPERDRLRLRLQQFLIETFDAVPWRQEPRDVPGYNEHLITPV